MNKYKQTLNEYKRLEETAKEQIKEILSKKSDNKVEFNWEECEAPSYASGQFTEDVVDVYIKRVYLLGDLIIADLHAYYLGEDTGHVELACEPYMDWFDLLMYLNETIK